MIGSYYFIYLILSCFISIIYPQTSDVTSSAEFPSKLGPCACGLFGIDTSECPDYAIYCDQLPHECSGYFWTEIRVTLYYNILDVYSRENDVYLKRILNCTKIPVIIGYGYRTVKEWSLVLGCCGADGINVQDEVEALKIYREEHPNIAGLALMNLDTPSSKCFENFTENLNCYVNTLKELMPDLDIGIYIFADELQSKYEDSNVNWINFKELTENVNFFVVTFNNLYIDCTPELIDGIYPVTGNNNFTLEKFTKILDAFGIPAKKTSFKFELPPNVPPYIVDLGFPSLCYVNTQQMCKDPGNSTCFCSDTTATFYEKGVFAKNYGAGFVAMPVDKDDVFCDCQCGRPFPSFRAILDGFEGAPCPPPCHLLDRNH